MAAPLGLHDSFTEDGYWWIEGREGHKVGGTLTFDPENGAKLALLGTLDDVIAAMRSSLRGGGDSTTIYGTTKKGRPVTLLHALNVNRQMHMPGITHEKWSSNLLVIGLHLESEEAEIFPKSYFRFDSIEEWLGHKPFDSTLDDTEKCLTVKATKPREEPFADHDDFKVTSVGSLYTNNTPDTRFTIDVISQFGVTPATPKSLNWHLMTAVRLQELASLCTGYYLPLTAFELRGPDQKIGKDMVRPSEVHVYTQMMHPEAEKPNRRDPPIVAGPELVAHNPKAIQHWFDQYELFSPAINLFFTVTAQREMFTNVRFLLAIQALEVFHRRTNDETVMPPADFPAFADMMVKAIPASATARMKEKLKNSTYQFLNELSLGQRLKSIIAGLASSFGVTPPAFTRDYLQRLVATRNYYTHFSQELEDKTLDGEGMYWASRRIVLLLTLLFLQRLGLTGTDLAPLLKRHQEFSKLWARASDPF